MARARRPRLILNLLPLQRIINSSPTLAWVKISDLAGSSSGVALFQPEANWHASDQLKAKRLKVLLLAMTPKQP